MDMELLKKDIEAKRAELEEAVLKDDSEKAYEKSVELDKLIESYIEENER